MDEISGRRGQAIPDNNNVCVYIKCVCARACIVNDAKSIYQIPAELVQLRRHRGVVFLKLNLSLRCLNCGPTSVIVHDLHLTTHIFIR